MPPRYGKFIVDSGFADVHIPLTSPRS